MALTPAEEAGLRQLLGQSPQLLSLAGNEPAIIQELGAQDVTIQDLQLASTALETDKLIGRLGSEDKAILLSVLKSFMNNGMATSAELSSLLPKRSFSIYDFIRIPDEPGGLIVQWGTVTSGEGGNGQWAYPVKFPSARLGVMATFQRTNTSQQESPTITMNNISDQSPLTYTNFVLRNNGFGVGGFAAFTIAWGF